MDYRPFSSDLSPQESLTGKGKLFNRKLIQKNSEWPPINFNSISCSKNDLWRHIFSCSTKCCCHCTFCWQSLELKKGFKQDLNKIYGFLTIIVFWVLGWSRNDLWLVIWTQTNLWNRKIDKFYISFFANHQILWFEVSFSVWL